MSNEKRNFSEAAATWDDNPARVRLSQDIATAMKAAVRIGRDIDVLDFGCGTGLVTLSIAPAVRRMIGADSSSGMLEVLSAKAAAQGVQNVEGRLLDLDAGDDVSERFHLVISSMTLHHVQDTAALFRRWFDWLLPGGQIAAADLETEPGTFHADNTGVFHFGFERRFLADALTSAGFTDVRVTEATVARRPQQDGTTTDFPILLLTGTKPA